MQPSSTDLLIFSVEVLYFVSLYFPVSSSESPFGIRVLCSNVSNGSLRRIPWFYSEVTAGLTLVYKEIEYPSKIEEAVVSM